jgi:type I restriction enzyme S subunit
MTDMSKEMKILGRSAIIDKNDEYILNQRIGRLRANNEIILNEYLHYITNNEFFLEQLYTVAKGSAQKYVNTNEIKFAKIPLPPVDMQKRIVELVSKTNSQIQEKLEQIRTIEANTSIVVKEILFRNN